MRGRHNGHRPFRPHGGYPPSQPPFVPQNPNFALQDPNLLQFLQSFITPAQPNFALQQNPSNFFFPNPNAYSLPQNPNIPNQQQPQQVFSNPSSSQSQLLNQRGSAANGQVPKEVQERANQAVNQAWQELFASGNSVTAWKVSEAALVALRADSWSSLGLDMQGIPSFQKLMTIEGRVNAFIQCFVGVRRITTLYELEMAICENEGVRTYDKLELGPLLRHPLVLHFFSLNSNCTEVFKITSDDVIAHLHEYMDSHKSREIIIDEFLDFVADKQAATNKEELGVRIRSLEMYTSFIKKAERKKDFEVKKCQKGVKVKKHCKGLKLKERYMNISQQVESFMSVHKDFCGKHIRFDSSSSEEEDANDSAHENERNDHGEGSESELPSEVISSSDRVSRCPYPSATNYGFKRPVDVSVHFSKEFENPVNINRLTNGMGLKWHEVDKTYLKHPASRLLSCGLKKWREFFLEIGVTDFVQVVQLDKSFMDMSHTVLQSLSSDWDLISPGSVVKDWESYELVQLLSLLSTSCNHEGCKYMLEILDEFWDGHFSEKATGCCNFKSGSEIKPFRSSFLCKICDIPWVVSTMDDKLHYPNELFHDCDPVRAILGACAPYAVPKVRNEKLVKDIGLKTEVTLDDVLKILKLWRSEMTFKASIAQMLRLYTFIWNEVRNSRHKISEEFHSASFIFVPNNSTSRPDDVVPGLFLSSKEVFWHDSTGTMDQMYNHSQSGSSVENHLPLNRTLSNIYPGLHDFFVNECKVPEKPSFCGYLDILLQLSALTLPSQAANAVFQVFLKWADALKSDLLSTEDIRQMKECLSKPEYTVLPTVLDMWVSLHPSFGLVCWCDDEELKKRFKHLDNIDFLYFGTLNDGEKELLQTKVSILIRTLGIPVLSEVVTREAIFDGKADDRFRASLVNWALPFAQRYIYSVHPDKYIQLKQSGLGNINNLQIVVVDKLYYRNVIRSCGIVSKKKFQCTCLLQENILYATPESDSHAVYMEFSRLLFDGTPDLHLANFLHMVTTMAKSGSNEEQTEFFILNSQKVPKLPDEEPIWSLSSMSYETENNEFLESSTTTAENEQSSTKSKKKTGIYSNWPPVDWKTAPGLSKRPPISQPIDGSKTTYNGSEHIGSHTSSDGPVEIDTDIFPEDNTETTSLVPILPDSEHLDRQYGNTGNPIDSGVRIAFGNTCIPVDSGVRISFDPVDLSLMSDSPQLVSLEFNKRNQQNSGFVSSEFSQRDQLLTGTPSSAQALLTGKLGELVAFKYFTGSSSGKTVKWVNKDSETGLPYDLVLEDERGHIEYVEVKATKSARKDWFNISTREWQFAAEKGDCFSIAHVFLLSEKEGKIGVYRNPIKLCQQGKLQLVVLMPRQRQDSTIIS